MAQYGAVEAHNGDVDAQNGALEGLYTSVANEKQDPDPHWSENMDPDRIKMMRIRNHKNMLFRNFPDW